jgi:hypothetical protein
VRARVLRLLDAIGAEVLLGCQNIVCAAAEGEIGRRVLPAICEGFQVMKLEAVGFAAALPGGVGVRAAPVVAFEHGAPNRGGDVSAALARVIRAGAGRRSDGVGIGGG